MAAGGTHVLGEGRTLTVVTGTGPGTFSRVAAGVLAVGLDVSGLRPAPRGRRP